MSASKLLYLNVPVNRTQTGLYMNGVTHLPVGIQWLFRQEKNKKYTYYSKNFKGHVFTDNEKKTTAFSLWSRRYAGEILGNCIMV